MRRREFIAIAGGAALWPLAAHTQQAAMPVVGFLNFASPEAYRPMADAFRQGLRETGFVEGQNVTIEYRWAENHRDRLPDMALDLVHRQVTVIAATSTPAALAAQAATRTIPIIFETGADPVQLGLVTNLNRPSGNLTGVTQLTQGLVPKELEVLHELLPSVGTVALLVNPADPIPAENESKEGISTAQTLGLKLHVLKASTEADLDAVFASLSQLGAGALVIGSDPFFTSRPAQLAALATRYKVPAIYKGREFAAAGVYTGQILKGQKPADLPVQQATKFELYLNLKTAKALDITVPLTLSGRADEVIE